MKSIAIEEVSFIAMCKVCKLKERVRLIEVTHDGAVALYEGHDNYYCRCGGEHRTSYQAAITADPENRPVMKIVPVGDVKVKP